LINTGTSISDDQSEESNIDGWSAIVLKTPVRSFSVGHFTVTTPVAQPRWSSEFCLKTGFGWSNSKTDFRMRSAFDHIPVVDSLERVRTDFLGHRDANGAQMT